MDQPRVGTIFQPKGIAIYDDYGHHPIEINAVLAAARAGTKGQLIAVVEPHRYSRVRDLFQDFCNCFSDADSVFVTPLYSAGEAPIEGISSESLATGIRATGVGSVATVADINELASQIRGSASEGDMVVCLGAGFSTEWAYALPALIDN